MEDHNQNEFEALCPECGHAFKAYMDRVLQPEPLASAMKHIECPVCGCGECNLVT